MVNRIRTSGARAWTWARAAGASLAVLAALAAAPAGALTLTLSPATATPAPGDPFAVDLLVSGLGDGSAPSLGAFDVTLTFDAAAVSFVSVGFDAYLGAIPAEATAGSVLGAGTLALGEYSILSPAALDALQPGSFRLATVVFEATSLAPSAIGFGAVLLGDADGRALALTTPPTGTTVSPIPEPTAALVFGLAVAVVARASRGRRSAG